METLPMKEEEETMESHIRQAMKSRLQHFKDQSEFGTRVPMWCNLTMVLAGKLEKRDVSTRDPNCKTILCGGTRKLDSTRSFWLDLNMEVEVHETRLLKVQCYRGRKR